MAISRYKNFKEKIDPTTLKKRLETFPPISSRDLEDPSDIIIRFQDGQRLDRLAFDYLGDGRYWWAICLLNNISLPFGSQITPGTLLRVPLNISGILNKIEQRIDKI